jgi:signal transduction histidine kinase/CheY-like chemotaxis protein
MHFTGLFDWAAIRECWRTYLPPVTRQVLFNMSPSSNTPRDRSLLHRIPLHRIPLRAVLIVPFVLQTFAAVGLTGYLSLRNGQKAVNDVASQLRSEEIARVDQNLNSYLTIPHQITQITQDVIDLGWMTTQNPRDWRRHFWQQLQVFPSVWSIGLGNEQGSFSGFDRVGDHKFVQTVADPDNQFVFEIYALNENGDRTGLIKRKALYNPRERPWYKKAVADGKATWSPVFKHIAEPQLLIAAARPIYDANRKLMAVTVAQLDLSTVGTFLKTLEKNRHGSVFILERDGKLVASSSDAPLFLEKHNKTERISALNSQDSMTQATAQFLNQKFGGFDKITSTQQLEFDLNGKRQFVQVSPFQDDKGLDWLVVVAVPESAFMAQINANTRNTILLCLGALGLTTLLGIYTSRWISKPILKLQQASEAIAAGELDRSVEVSSIHELEGLAQSFNQMAVQLKSSFTELEDRVTERTVALQQAKEVADSANSAKSDFLANMSHELRTPLNGILGYAQILQRDPSLNDKGRKGINIIQQCGNHLLTLINDVLDLSKIEARKMELHPSDVHLPSFLEGIAEICGVRAEQKGIDFIYDPPDLPMGVRADEKRLRQVLINLLGNAIKFTDQGSVTFLVEIEASEKTNFCHLRFSIKDTGVGMATDQLEQIFIPFEQVGSTKKQSEGTGLGLSISQRIVELMGTTLKVQSQLGMGSTFWFEMELPESKEWAIATPKNIHGTITGYQGSKRKILIVDDRWENRAVIVNLLEPIGFEMLEANDGQAGLAQLAMQPDLVITDLAMPVMDGFAMLKHLRQDPAFQNLPVIVSSASVFEIDQDQSIAAGGTTFLAKPVQAETLFDQLQELLMIEWIYKPTNAIASEAEMAAELVPPPVTTLKQFAEMLEAGDLFQAQEEAQKLAETQPQYGAFAQTVAQLAESFQTKKLTALIQKYLETE